LIFVYFAVYESEGETFLEAIIAPPLEPNSTR
jgi:hypothetical protein